MRRWLVVLLAILSLNATHAGGEEIGFIEDFALARDWRFFSREFFETTFTEGYIVTDFVFERKCGGCRHGAERRPHAGRSAKLILFFARASTPSPDGR